MFLRPLRKAGRCGDPRTCIGNSHFPATSVAEWLRGILLPLLAIGCVGKLVLDVMLILFDGGEPVVEAGVLHLLLMIAHGLVMVAIGKEGHVFPNGHSRPPHMAAAGSSQSCHPTIAHLSPDARSCQHAKEQAGPN